MNFCRRLICIPFQPMSIFKDCVILQQWENKAKASRFVTLNQVKLTSGAPSALHVIVALLPLAAAAFPYTGDLSTSGATVYTVHNNDSTVSEVGCFDYNVSKNTKCIRPRWWFLTAFA